MEREELIKSISDGFEIAKSGQGVASYHKFVGFLDDGSMPVKSHYAYAWIIYYAMHQSGEAEIIERKKMLVNYFKLRLPVPHKLHSMILTEAIRLYKDSKNLAFCFKGAGSPAFSIVKFMELWGYDNMRPGDWNRKEYEGKQLISTVEKLITIYVDELEECKTPANGDFILLIDRALEKFPDSYNLLSQRASLHVLFGEKDAAISALQRALLMAPNKYYLWQRLANLIDPEENPSLHVALLYKALKSPGPEQFKGKVRASLASVFASKGAFPQALWEIEKMKGEYEANGWHLPKMAVDAAAEIPDETVADSPERIYRKVEHMAEAMVYDSLPSVSVRKSYHKNPSPKDRVMGKGRPMVAWRVTDETGRNYWFNPARMNIDESLPIATPLFVRIFNGKIVKADLEPIS